LKEWTPEADPEHRQIGINRAKEGPLPIGQAEKDISLFGVRDMAGNGREWTRELFAPFGNEHEVPLTRAPNRLTDRVILRGHSYKDHDVLRFHEARFNSTAADAAGYRATQPDIGFRVVLEIPN